MAFPYTEILPTVGATESDTLDFKADVNPADRFELAKDIASFANAAGGTILIGACGGSVLAHLKALADDVADGTARAYEEASRDRCAPPVSVRWQKLPHAGGVILAMHVPAFPLPVAVRVRGDRSDGYGDDAWVFFSRVASQNKAFRPEVLPMLTPEIRRIAVLLRAIPPRATVNVVKRTKNDGGRQDIRNCNIKSVDETRNLVLLVEHVDGGERTHRVPLDCVRTAYEGHGEIWHVEVEHYFEAR